MTKRIFVFHLVQLILALNASAVIDPGSLQFAGEAWLNPTEEKPGVINYYNIFSYEGYSYTFSATVTVSGSQPDIPGGSYASPIAGTVWVTIGVYTEAQGPKLPEFQLKYRTYDQETGPTSGHYFWTDPVNSSALRNGDSYSFPVDLSLGLELGLQLIPQLYYTTAYTAVFTGIGTTGTEPEVAGPTQQTYLDCDIQENYLNTIYDITRETDFEIWWHGNDGNDELLGNGHYDFALGPTQFLASKTGCGRICLYISEDIGDGTMGPLDPVECTETTSGIPVTDNATLEPPQGGFSTADRQDDQTALLQSILDAQGTSNGGSTEAKQDATISQLDDIETDQETANQLLQEIRDSNQEQESQNTSLLSYFVDDGSGALSPDAVQSYFNSNVDEPSEEDAGSAIGEMESDAEGAGDMVTSPTIAEPIIPSGNAPTFTYKDWTITLDPSQIPIIALIAAWTRNFVIWILTLFLVYTFVTEVRTAIKTVMNS